MSDRGTNLYFLQGGGEMGELVRRTDWSNTQLGDPGSWPRSLQTTVALVLENPFPMYIAWGKEFIQIYNDSFRPILGTVKHPHALGTSTIETFAEIWDTIGPMFDSVMRGKPVRFPDLMLPLNRNGFFEDCHFDFSYSPIRKGDGSVGGILVTVMETTEKHMAIAALKQNEVKTRSVIESAPFPIGVYVGKEMRVEFANQAIIDTWKKGSDVINKSFKDIVPEVESQEIFKQVQSVLDTGVPFHAKNERVDLLIDGVLKPFYFNYSFTPLIDASGKVYAVMNTAADVTDLNLAKQKIEESESRLRKTILRAPIAMCMFRGPNHVVELANDLMFELWGKSPEALQDKPLFEGLFEARNQGFEELLDGVYRTGETVRAEGIPVRLPRNGEMKLYYVNILYQPYRDIGNSITGILAVAVDVTEQVIGQRKIQEAQQKAQLAIDSAELGVYEVHYGKDQAVIDKKFAEFFGLQNASSRSLFAHMIHPDDAKIRENAHKASLVSGHLKYQARFILKDKSIRWLKLTGKVIFDDHGKPQKLIGVGQDVTASIMAQKEIEESEKTIRKMVQQAPVAMCILKGPSFTVDLANDLMYKIWGKPESAFLKKPIFEGLPEAKEQGIERLLQDVYKTGITFVANEREVKLPRHGNVETTYLNFVYEPFKRGDGTVVGIIAVATDVTAQVNARHKIEEVVSERTRDLADANDKLRKSNEELAQFAYIASHDLQEPLRKITTFSQMLEARLGAKLDDSSRNLLEKINDSSSRMNRLIRDILSYSELAREREVYSSVNLNSIVEQVTADYELQIESKGAVIECDTLPPIQAIPLQMVQLFTNLIGNSLKFAKPEARPVIRISATQTGGNGAPDACLNLRFSDNGIGIKPEYTEQIFNIFQRLHRKSEYEGTGIGLAMCKKIVLNHHGSIDAVGSNEQGAVFNIRLPVRQTGV